MKLSVMVLAFIMLVSSSGIVQVTHICKMSLAKHKITACNDNSADAHSCCKLPVKKQASGSGCCNTIIKFYVNKAVTILNEKSDFKICKVPENLMYRYNQIGSIFSSENFIIYDPEFPPDAIGKQKIISISSFLI